ncbi:hypothetical protein BV898_20010, partial [Hypsibius exemplaris]
STQVGNSLRKLLWQLKGHTAWKKININVTEQIDWQFQDPDLCRTLGGAPSLWGSCHPRGNGNALLNFFRLNTKRVITLLKELENITMIAGQGNTLDALQNLAVLVRQNVLIVEAGGLLTFTRSSLTAIITTVASVLVLSQQLLERATVIDANHSKATVGNSSQF